MTPIPQKKSIQDTYQILEDIGKGGMAQVYKAVQNSLGRVVAIKEIKPAIAASPEMVERFKREARTAASLVHENIVQVYNFGEQKKSGLFIVMEYVEGQDLKSLIAKSDRINPGIAAIIGREIARALAFAHSKGLIHRDVKPGNVMLSTGGEVKLMDFGIVREADSDLTSTGALMGTPSYMAPEQFLGEKVSPAADLFSLGVVIYEALTGEKPFRADSDTSLSKAIRTEKEKKVRTINPQVPGRLQKIVHQCLKKDPLKRPQTAEDLAGELDRFIRSKSREDDKKELGAWVSGVMEAERTAVLSTGDEVQVKDMPAEPKEKARDRSARSPAKDKAARSAKEKAPEEKAAARSRPEKSKKAPVEKEEAGEQAEIGRAIVRWLWRAVLVLLATLVAVVVFMRYNPLLEEKPSAEPSQVERVMQWVRDKAEGIISHRGTEGTEQKK